MAIWIVLPILTLLMFDLGLSLKFEDFGKVFTRPWPIVVALVGQLVLLPLIALGLAWAFRLEPVFGAGVGVQAGAGIFYRPYLNCLLPGGQFVQCVFQAGWGRCRPVGNPHRAQ